MKFMMNGALTLGTMDGANIEIVNEAGEDNAEIFGLSSDEVIRYENEGGYDPMELFNNDSEIREVLMELINGTYSDGDMNLFRDIYDSLLKSVNGSRADTYFVLKDFKSYVDAQARINDRFKDKEAWTKSALINIANSGKFSSDRTIQEYVDDIWKLEKVHVEL